MQARLSTNLQSRLHACRDVAGLGAWTLHHSTTAHRRHWRPYPHRQSWTRIPSSNARPCSWPQTPHRPADRLPGERLCRAWLIEHHWHVLACNWHCRFGEIDIIALTPHSTIVFVEVKTRRSTSCGIPEEAVHAAKQMRVRRAAICWLGEHGSTIRHIGVRFDVIAVTVTPTDVFIHHVPEAF